jgi:hypothetical protein
MTVLALLPYHPLLSVSIAYQKKRKKGGFRKNLVFCKQAWYYKYAKQKTITITGKARYFYDREFISRTIFSMAVELCKNADSGSYCGEFSP